VSGYDWWDGVGPKDRRPTKLDLAWQSLESNQFGTNEFMVLARKMGWTPMFAANLGTGTPAEARNWVEYCNGAPGSYWADLRVEHGYPTPHNVKLWCLGNEMDGSWQIGHVPAREYAIRAQQTSRLMKMYDSTLETVVCGSCGTGLSSYMEWDREVLEHCHDDVDYVSLHRYVGNEAGNSEEFLASVGPSVDKQIEELDSVCRFVAAHRRSKRRVFLSFDEWNIWYRARYGGDADGKGKHAPPLLEEVYNLEDALVAGQFLNSFINHADSVKIANLAQIVNVIAPMLTIGDRLLIQSIFFPFEMMSKRRDGVAMRCAVDGPSVHSADGDSAQVDASAILHRGGSFSVFLVNRSVTRSAEVCIHMGGVNELRLISGEIITGTDPNAANSLEQPSNVVSIEYAEINASGNDARMKLPPLSMFAGTFGVN
jgi:alpha-N-arabinofuranosidase